MQSSSAHAAFPPDVAPTLLTEEQCRHFRTFGFVLLRGLFAPDIDRIIDGFEHVFATEEVHEFTNDLHHEQVRRVVAPGFIDRSDRLSWLRTDPRLVGIANSLVGPDHEYEESDGNLFSGDTGWHSDLFGVTRDRLHIKVYFYLDSLRAGTGALRVIPGTNSWNSPFAMALRSGLWSASGAQEQFGVDERDIPCVILETEPGDVTVGDFRTMHATFGGSARRRLFTVNFGERPAENAAGNDDVQLQAPWHDPSGG